MTKKSLHLALLVCDTPLPQVIEKYGDYPRQYAVVFEKAAQNKDVDISWEFFDVVESQAYPNFEDIENKKYDAIVVTGSKYNAHDNSPWILKLVDFLKRVQKEPYSQIVKLVGICFGHQVICRAAGGTTERNPKGWEIGYTEIELNSNGKAFFKTDKNKLVSVFIKISHIFIDHMLIKKNNRESINFTVIMYPFCPKVSHVWHSQRITQTIMQLCLTIDNVLLFKVIPNLIEIQ